MAQPNVAREPSMDEILASIRRIIENNEAHPDFIGDDRAGDLDIAAHDGDMLSSPAIVEAFHAEEPPVAADPEPRRHEAGQPALSLADVAARVRAASERHVANREGASAPLREPAESAVVTPHPAVSSVRPAIVEITVDIDEPAEEPALSAEAPSFSEEPAELPHDIAALVSPAVSERVAQSFGALAEAVDAGPRRSFDEIAEDMLRPMLREWLEDNLPTLVERLVREEIERVARGPRR